MDSSRKIVTAAEVKRKLYNYRKHGKKIAFTNGCFDIIHFGHISYLQKAKKKARILIVGLNSDSSIRGIKGKKRPIVLEKQRAYVLSALECVDFIVVFNEATPSKLIEYLKPDILIKGADWKGKKIAGEDFVRSYSGKIEYINYIPRCSSTNIIETIIKKCGK